MLTYIRRSRYRAELIREAIEALERVTLHHAEIMEAVEEGSSALRDEDLPRTYSAFVIWQVPRLVEELRAEF